jgi:flagellar motor protein MotB
MVLPERPWKGGKTKGNCSPGIRPASSYNKNGILTPNQIHSAEKKHPNRNVLIEGHTDSVGSDEYNQVLSAKRADSVKYALVKDGIEADRITTVGYGKKYPVASNESATGRAQNRRVDVIILNEGVDAQTQIRK